MAWFALVSVGCGSKPGLAPTSNDPSSSAPVSAEPAGAVEEASSNADPALDAERAHAELARLTQELEELDVKVAAAVDAMMSARTDRERAGLRPNLESLLEQKQELMRRIGEARAAAWHADRVECEANPLAKGCM